jgi:chromosome segregation ATPase
MFRKKENQKLDQIISQLSSSDLHKTLENKIESINKDLDRYQGWYWKEADIAKKLKQIQSELELKVFTLEKQIEFYKNNEENFNSLKKELGERLNKVNRQERLLDDRQITLDTKLEEISKQQAQYVELLKVFHIKHDIRDSCQKTNETAKEDSVNQITDEINP